MREGEQISISKTEFNAPGAIAARWQRLISSEHWVLYLSLIYFLALLPFAPELASTTSVSNIFINALPLLVVTIGQTFVLLTAGIDLSVTAIIGLTSVVGALVMSRDQGWFGTSRWAAVLGIAAMLLVGLLIGLTNGLAVAKLKMPAFIVTLTTMMFGSGLAVWLTQSRTIYGLPAGFNALGKGALFFIPYALLIALLLVVVAHVSLRRSLFGRWLYAVGGNWRAARVSGVPVERVVVAAYVISGGCAALAAILYTGRMETGSPVLGQRILLDVIGAAVIGGVSLFGGRGRVAAVVYGVLFISLLDYSLNLLDQSYFVIMMIKGAVILGAALLDVWRTGAAKR